jgi:hypothetical protein
MDITKPNDILVTSMLTPDVNVYDLAKSNISPDNTSFLSKEEYKESEFIQKAFTNEQGDFDDIQFNNSYNSAAKLFNEISNDNHLTSNLE